uniref:Uncharacterized protein n=1 Tax=Caulobacter phage BL57 TaxID=3348355 RepID=A0AB74ULE5_9VIRU
MIPDFVKKARKLLHLYGGNPKVKAPEPDAPIAGGGPVAWGPVLPSTPLGGAGGGGGVGTTSIYVISGGGAAAPIPWVA